MFPAVKTTIKKTTTVNRSCLYLCNNNYKSVFVIVLDTKICYYIIG